jgi:sugar/nucleoside kinase (ribokinase family)
VDFFICNVDEACGITGERDLVNAINKLVDEYACPCAVVTMGSEGALLRQRKTTESYSQVDPRREPVRVLCKEIIDSPLIDTVGVGDAFCGGFLFEIVNRDLNPYSPDLPEAVRFGCACGSAALTVIGGSTFPGLAQVRECLID